MDCEITSSSKLILSSLKEFENRSENLTRKICNYKDLSSKFILPQLKNYNVQYSNLYFVRLEQMKRMFTKNYNLTPILNIPTNKPCYLCGVLYKEMKLKPSILQKLSGTLETGSISRTSYMGEDDKLYLEDENGKVNLELSIENISLHDLCSGIVATVRGVFDGKIFKVLDILYASPAKPDDNTFIINKNDWNVRKTKHSQNQFKFNHYLRDNNEDLFILFVSGLNIDAKNSQESEGKFFELLRGNLAGNKLNKLMARVTKIIIAGNHIAQDLDVLGSDVSNFRLNELCISLNKQNKDSMLLFDKFLNSLAPQIPIDIMPGAHEPAGVFWPQQPLVRHFFQNSQSHINLKAVTNPYQFEIEKIKVLGTSGQNIHDIRKSCLKDAKNIDILEKTLIWGHIIPTAPETISCYPFTNEDPFVIEQSPDVYFAGNMNEFETKIHYNHENEQATRIISIPDFKNKKSFALLNLKNLDCFEIGLN